MLSYPSWSKEAVCKTVIVGSNPSESSNIFLNGEIGITMDFDSIIPSSSLGSEAKHGVVAESGLMRRS